MLGKTDEPLGGMLNGEIYTTNSPRDPTVPREDSGDIRLRYVQDFCFRCDIHKIAG